MDIASNTFVSQVDSGEAKVALLAQSNAGKSTLSRYLKEILGWNDCEVDNVLGFDDQDEINRFLGDEMAPSRETHEVELLRLEAEAVERFVFPSQGNTVLDLPGSAAHYPAPLLETLRQRCLLVHLAIDETAIPAMTERFTAVPKPVVWNGHFNGASGDNHQARVEASYPPLFKGRETAYKAAADISIPWSIEPDVTQFLTKVEQALSSK